MRHLFYIAVVFLCACTSIQRSNQSGYGKGGSTVVSRKSNLSRMNETSEINVSEKNRLKQLENTLVAKKEMEQYSKALPFFYSDYEKIEFLGLPGFEARQAWLRDQNFSDRNKALSDKFHEIIQANDIALGMPDSLVRQSWGDPDSVEVSGSPTFKNFRWRYFKYVSSSDGYKPEKKSVYFEGGRVVGWEMD